jgi:serine/threonine protein kinase
VDEGRQYDVRLADFGLSRFMPEDEKLLFDKCGTPCYVAPEILRGEGYRERADIFSAGSVFFNLLTGRYLFNGLNN